MLHEFCDKALLSSLLFCVKFQENNPNECIRTKAVTSPKHLSDGFYPNF